MATEINQKEINTQLEQLKTQIQETTQEDIKKHALSLYQKLFDVNNKTDNNEERELLLKTISTVQNALKNTGDDHIQELMELSEITKDHVSPIWKGIGICMMLLGTSLALATGMLLTAGTMGLGASIGACFVVGVTGALMGFGLFANNSQHGLSKDIVELAKSLPKP